MNYKNKNLEELGKKIDDLDNQNKESNIKKKRKWCRIWF
jgi:hypothetical protein